MKFFNTENHSLSREQEVEKSAQYEGNHTLLLIRRLQNKEIRKQILHLERKLHSFNLELLDIDIAIEDAKKITEISSHKNACSTVRPYGNVVVNNAYLPTSKRQVPTSLQLNMIEAHEKGHQIRKHSIYSNEKYNVYFRHGFDFSKMLISDEDKAWLNLQDDDVIRKKIIHYFNGAEIAERMSQLKNYFGFVGDEIFTKEHLDYARANYVKDLGFNNNMTHFFQSITSETETAFLELINNSGI